MSAELTRRMLGTRLAAWHVRQPDERAGELVSFLLGMGWAPPPTDVSDPQAARRARHQRGDTDAGVAACRAALRGGDR